MTATYADDESTSGSGSEERKATSAWTCEVSEETRGTSLLTVASSNVSHEGLDAGGVAPRRTEESPRSMKIEEDSRSDSVVSIEGSYVFVPRVRSDCSSVENFEDEKGEEKMGSSGNCEGDGEQVSTIKTEGNKSQRKISNEMDLPIRNEDTVKKKTSLYEETIESDDRRSSVEDLCRSIEKELMVNEETKRFSPKKIIVTCGPFVTSSNNIACRIIGDDERNEEVAEVEDYTKDESYDPEIGLDFHEAVRAGDAQRVATLLADNRVQNLDEPDWNVSGDPPLLVAATNHSLPVLNILLENGCDPGVRSPRGETALHRVILNGGPGNVLNFVEELLKYDCPAGVKEAGGGLTALHVLTRQLAHAQSSKSLHHDFEAALKTLDLLAKAGPINAKDHQGRSALHILASSTIFDNNHKTEIESLMETLLAAGANPALKNDRGETPLHECLECGALNTASLLIPHTPPGIMSRYGETPLHIASRKNYVDMVAKLLEHGEDPSVQDAGGNTPLHLASARGFHRTVSLLITSPLAQLEKTNLDGLTALQVAAESGFVNAVRLLLKAGADPSQTVHYCTTTLHRHPDISILIDHELTRRRQLAA